MNNPRAHRACAWIALAAMAWALLAPGVSRALAARLADASAWDQVCSVAGDPASTTPDGDAAGRTRLRHALEHCPLCALGLDKLAPPVASFTWGGVGAVQPQAARAATAVIVPHPLQQPPVRGPPVLPLSDRSV